MPAPKHTSDRNPCRPRMSGLFAYFDVYRPGEAAGVVDHMGRVLCRLPHHHAECCAVSQIGAVGRMRGGLLNEGCQPHTDETGVSAWLTGEFYHQADHRRTLDLSPTATDQHMAHAAYVHGGATAVSALNGAFVVAVWDPGAGELVIITDRYGLYPHYLADGPGWFACAPEAKAVLVAPRVSRRPDVVALAQYVRFQQVLGERTWCEAVRLIPPASIVRFNVAEGRVRVQRYWDWDHIGHLQTISFGEAVEEATRLFQRSVDAMTEGPARVGVYLSGGLDSRTILGFVRDEIPAPTLTFGVGGSRDVVFGGRLARAAGRSNTWCPLNGGDWIKEHAPLHFDLTEGFHSWMHAHGMSTLQTARELMDVNLSGWDGGTVLGGFIVHEEGRDDDYYRMAPSESELVERMREAFCRRVTWPGLTDEEALTLFSPPGNPSWDQAARESFGGEFARTSHYPPDRRSDYFYVLQHVRRSTGNMLVFMRSMIEVRAPFLDYAFVDFMYSLPRSVRTTSQFRRAVLTRRAARLAWVPRDRDQRLPHANRIVRGASDLLVRAGHRVDRLVGTSLAKRPTLYVDYETLLRTELRDWAEGHLRSFTGPAAQGLNGEIVQQLWARHLDGRQAWTIGKVAPLITLAMVERAFFS
jgi:asparagine synthase (glutamine-hydrolysing)